MNANSVEKELRDGSDVKRAALLLRFFKTGKGEYGEGDRFLGLTVPQVRGVVQKYKDLTLPETEKLIHNPYHECRLAGLLILCLQYKKADDVTRRNIVNLYLQNTSFINSWDLVDLSSHHIIGEWLVTRLKERKILYTLAGSDNLWEKRISVISCFAFLRHNDFTDILSIAQILLHDKNDLIHKAVGWALREVGKRDIKKEETFLLKHHKTMPRTMLRYAIEKFPESKRRFYMGS